MLKHWSKQLEEAERLVWKPGHAERAKSLIENMGTIARGEWDRLQHTPTASDESKPVKDEEKERYNPSPYPHWLLFDAGWIQDFCATGMMFQVRTSPHIKKREAQMSKQIDTTERRLSSLRNFSLITSPRPRASIARSFSLFSIYVL